MAKSLAHITCIQIIVITLITLTCAQAEQYQVKKTTISFFFQDSTTGPNASNIAVAGKPGKPRNFNQFGTVFVTDDPLTTGIDQNSMEIGRGQGMYVTCSLDGRSTCIFLSIVFTSADYNGSTLDLQGRVEQLAKVREYSIVSGTGKFRFARGIASIETVFASTDRSVERCNITVFTSDHIFFV